MEPGCQFASDNTAGICLEAMEALLEANHGSAPPYGEDRWTKRAGELIREIFEVDCRVFFTFNGTAANSLAMAALCQSYHSVISHEMSHIETDECGGPEFFSGGTKLLQVSGMHGCVDADAVEEVARRRTDVHFPKAKVLSITQSTEVGTVYDQAALEQIHQAVTHLKLNLHMDGARLSNAIATLGIAPKESTWKHGVDVLCMGGTKNGMPVGDCVIFFNQELAHEFEYRCKQAGQLASKMRYLAAPWAAMLESGAWLENARRANAMATRLSNGLKKISAIKIVQPVQANAVFVRFPDDVASILRQDGWQFYPFIDAQTSRLMCSWATTEQEVDYFLKQVTAACGTGTPVS